MVFINIPFVAENKKIDAELVIKTLQPLDISEEAKYTAFESIYNLKPRGVSFAEGDLSKALLLENALSKLGVCYRQSEESEHIFGDAAAS